MQYRLQYHCTLSTWVNILTECGSYHWIVAPIFLTGTSVWTEESGDLARKKKKKKRLWRSYILYERWYSFGSPVSLLRFSLNQIWVNASWDFFFNFKSKNLLFPELQKHFFGPQYQPWHQKRIKKFRYNPSRLIGAGFDIISCLQMSYYFVMLES